jgi:phasin family protein
MSTAKVKPTAAKPIAAKPAAAAPAAPVVPAAPVAVIAPAAAAAVPPVAPVVPAVVAAVPAEVVRVVAEAAVAVVSEVAVAAKAKAGKGYDDAVRYGKENVDAVVEAGTILSRGLQDIGKLVIGLTQEQVEQTMAASKAVLGVKSLHDLIDLQSLLVRSSLDRLLSEGVHLSDRSVKLVQEAFRPIGARVNATVDKLVKSAA